MRYKISPEQVEAWVARHFEYKKRQGGKEILTTNPFVLGDDKFKFNISLVAKESRNSKGRKDYWVHDWRPDKQEWDGSFVRFVQQYKNIPYFEAIRDICGSNLVRAIEERQEEIEEEEQREIEIPKNIKFFRSQENTQLRLIALGYLLSRKIDEELAMFYNLGYSASSILFPYYEYGILVYWQMRDMLNKRFHFPGYEEFGVRKSDFLYGFDNIEPGQDVFITEAIIDSYSVGKDCLASGGADMSTTQIKKLRSLLPGRVILAPDNDDAGIASLRKNYFILKNYFSEIFFVLPPSPYKDWNSMDQDGQDSSLYAHQNISKLNTPVIYSLTR